MTSNTSQTQTHLPHLTHTHTQRHLRHRHASDTHTHFTHLRHTHISDTHTHLSAGPSGLWVWKKKCYDKNKYYDKKRKNLMTRKEKVKSDLLSCKTRISLQVFSSFTKTSPSWLFLSFHNFFSFYLKLTDPKKKFWFKCAGFLQGKKNTHLFVGLFSQRSVPWDFFFFSVHDFLFLYTDPKTRFWFKSAGYSRMPPRRYRRAPPHPLLARSLCLAVLR